MNETTQQTNVTKTMTQRVRDALDNTKSLEPAYFGKMMSLRSELEGGIGSVYPLKAEHIQNALMSCVWQVFDHPSILAGCTAAVAQIGGRLGIVQITDLPDTASFTLIDPKGTGYCEILLSGAPPRIEVGHTVLIMGPHSETKREVVYTFHPGDPIMPSRVTGLEHGKVITKAKAQALGFEWAKVA